MRAAAAVCCSPSNGCYLEATVLFFIEREIRLCVVSILFVIYMGVLTLYTLLALIQTLMHRVVTLLAQ